MDFYFYPRRIIELRELSVCQFLTGDFPEIFRSRRRRIRGIKKIIKGTIQNQKTGRGPKVERPKYKRIVKSTPNKRNITLHIQPPLFFNKIRRPGMKREKLGIATKGRNTKAVKPSPFDTAPKYAIRYIIKTITPIPPVTIIHQAAIFVFIGRGGF